MPVYIICSLSFWALIFNSNTQTKLKFWGNVTLNFIMAQSPAGSVIGGRLADVTGPSNLTSYADVIGLMVFFL